eukprot:6205398-Pleurochrysis_carterae.AAC.1
MERRKGEAYAARGCILGSGPRDERNFHDLSPINALSRSAHRFRLPTTTQFAYQFWKDRKRYSEPSYHFMNAQAACLEDMYFKLRRKPRRVPGGPE